jgi:hypothetical protein
VHGFFKWSVTFRFPYEVVTSEISLCTTLTYTCYCENCCYLHFRTFLRNYFGFTRQHIVTFRIILGLLNTLCWELFWKGTSTLLRLQLFWICISARCYVGKYFEHSYFGFILHHTVTLEMIPDLHLSTCSLSQEELISQRKLMGVSFSSLQLRSQILDSIRTFFFTFQ